MRKALILALLGVCIAATQVEAKKKKTCAVKFGGCDKSRGLCWNVDEGKGSFCTCKAGYRFRFPSTRRGRCYDIDECKAKLHSCDTTRGGCINTIGSHRCYCRTAGYVLDYTKTKCLKRSHIIGLCSPRRFGKSSNRRRYDSDSEDSDAVKFWTRLFKSRNKKGRNKKHRCDKGRCKCEPGFEKRGGCKYCQDINECRKRKSKCDLKQGFCHNSDGGYYCSCRTGYVLGPCGFKCYEPTKRPSTCNSESFQSSSLSKGDSDGLNDETTKAVLLDYITEKIAKSGGKLSLFHTLMYKTCKTGGAKRVQRFDVDVDGKTDIIINYVCVGLKWTVKNVFDTEAKWETWSCWNTCKPTCSGGIQTRTRICKHGLVGEGRCKGPATEYKECYTGRKCKLRVRREAHSLNRVQKKDLIQAMRKYKKDTSNFGFHNAAGTHVFPYQCMGPDGNMAGCCYHGARLNFAMWHRAELLNFEEGLTRHLKDKTLGLPYWDWLKYPEPPALVWSKKLYGKENPFTSMTIRYDTTPHTLTQRSPTVYPFMVKVSKDNYYVAQKLMQSHTIHEFSEALENSHNTIHAAICWGKESAAGKCTYSMGSLTYAGFDPVFFFHHANVDRLFSVFQNWMSAHGEEAWTRQSVLEPQENIFHFNEPYLPFRNKTLTPFKKLQELASIQNMFYYRELLGYRYDNLAVPKLAIAKAVATGDAEKSHIPAATDVVVGAQFEGSIKSNVKISYYLGNKLKNTANIGSCGILSDSDERYLGSAQILGSKKERAWKSAQATVIALNFGKLGFHMWNNQLSATSDLQIQGCYTHNLYCTKNCKQVGSSTRKLIPSPQLLLYPKNIRMDVFKFEWASGTRFPTWVLNIKSGSQWIVFWGKEAKNVVQVASRSHYTSCNTVGAAQVKCEAACILSNGMHYFVHKTKCGQGMRLSLLAHV